MLSLIITFFSIGSVSSSTCSSFITSVSISKVGGTSSGIGVVSDYDGPFKEISDTSCNSVTFGLAFLTEKAYEDFKASGNAQKSEDYLYAYKLGEGRTDDDLKKYLPSLDKVRLYPLK